MGLRAIRSFMDAPLRQLLFQAVEQAVDGVVLKQLLEGQGDAEGLQNVHLQFHHLDGLAAQLDEILGGVPPLGQVQFCFYHLIQSFSHGHSPFGSSKSRSNQFWNSSVKYACSYNPSGVIHTRYAPSHSS